MFVVGGRALRIRIGGRGHLAGRGVARVHVSIDGIDLEHPSEERAANASGTGKDVAGIPACGLSSG
jgi:hypothetical protein